MKKNIFLGLIFILFILPLHSKTNDDGLEFWTKNKIGCFVFNDTFKKMDKCELSLFIKVNSKYKIKFKKYTGNIIQLYFNAAITRNCLEIIPEERMKILEIINKFKDWHKKALKEKVKIDKNINNIDYDLSWRSIYGDDWYHSKKDKMYFGFFSQSTKHHQLTIQFSKGHDINNSYIDNRPETLYLEYEQVLFLENFLSDDYINKQIEIAKKEKEKEDMFQ